MLVCCVTDEKTAASTVLFMIKIQVLFKIHAKGHLCDSSVPLKIDYMSACLI